MKKKIFLGIVLTLAIAFASLNVAMGSQVTAEKAGYQNIPFSNGYTGFCIDRYMHDTPLGESFDVAQNTSAADNNLDGSDVSQQLKLLFTYAFTDVFIDDGYGSYVVADTQALHLAMYHFIGEQDYIWGNSTKYVNKVNSYSGPAIPDHGHTITLSNGDIITFSFIVLQPDTAGIQDFFAYKFTVTPGEVPEPTHTHGDFEYVPPVDETCTTDGMKEHYICTVDDCEDKFADEEGTIPVTEEELIIPKGHDLGGWEEFKAPTCTEDGEERRECGREGCDYYEPKTIPAGHDMKYVPPVAPKCEEDGIIDYYKCVACGKDFKDEAGQQELVEKTEYTDPQTGHDYKLENRVEPNCTEPGSEHYVCQNDPTHEYTNPIAPLGHKTKLVPGVEPECEKDGVVEHYECTECQKTFKDEAGRRELEDVIDPQTGHDYKLENRVAPDCTEPGSEHYVCQNDPAHEYTNPIAPLGHKTSLVPGVEPECEKDGTVEHYKCSECEKTFKDEEGKEELKDVVIPATDHDYKLEDKVEPDCTESGYEHYVCQNDPTHEYTNPIAPLGHKTKLVPGVEPECEKDGTVEHYKCSKCEKTFKDEEGRRELKDITDPKTGHDYKLENRVEPDCTEPGSEHYVCQNDPAHEYTDPIAPLGHNYQPKVTKEPTCIGEGEIIYVCERNKSEHVYSEKVPPKGHEIELVPGVEPGCETEGNVEHYKCKECEKTFEDKDGVVEITAVKIVPETDHDFVSEVTKEPTCTEEGEETYICQNDESHTYTEEIPALGHDVEFVEGKYPTYTEEGIIDHYICTECERYFEDEDALIEIFDITIPKLVRPEAEEADSDTPNTGDHQNVFIWLAVLLAGSSSLFVATKRRRAGR